MAFLRKIFRFRSSRPGGKGDNQSDPSPNIPHPIISNRGAIDPKDADRHSIHSNTTESSVSSEALTRPESRRRKSLAVKSLSRESGVSSLAAPEGTSDESSPKMLLVDLLKKENASYRSGVQRIINNKPFVASFLFKCKLTEDCLSIQWPTGYLDCVRDAWSSVGLTQLQVSNGSMLVVDSIQRKLKSSVRVQYQIWNSTCVLVYNLPGPSSKVCFIALNLQLMGSLFLLTVDPNSGKPKVSFESVTTDFTVSGYDGQGQLFTLTQPSGSTDTNFENLGLSTLVGSDTYTLVADTGNDGGQMVISAVKKPPKDCATKFTFVHPVKPEQLDK